MAIIVTGISINLNYGEKEILYEATKKLGIKPAEISQIRIKRQSLDARRKSVRWVMSALITLYDKERQNALEHKFGKAEEYAEPFINYGGIRCGRPVVVGAGPCGLFAAHTLAKHGYRPLLIERGYDMAKREKDVDILFRTGLLDVESNICFGAGGAGAFSDGKLTTRINDSRTDYVLQTLVDFGAPKEILRLAHPHTGTEHIRKAVSGMINSIKNLGGEVIFGARLCGISLDGNVLASIKYIKNGVCQTIETGAALICIGHSARDTYEMLYNAGVLLEPKPFAVGLRIEHLREFIDKTQYGAAFGHPMLGAAEYRLAAKQSGRSVYTFCMCPGGEVINSSTEPDGIAVNGMSYYARNGINSNSAVVVGISPADFNGGALGGIAFQRRIERSAFVLTGKTGAPVQTVGGFFGGNDSFGKISPTFRPNAVPANLTLCLPAFISDAIKGGLAAFGKKLPFFDMPDAVLTGVETRTSSPVRIKRGNDFQAIGITGLYPAGEGAGYAGGIVSAAVDGIKCAQALMGAFSPEK